MIVSDGSPWRKRRGLCYTQTHKNAGRKAERAETRRRREARQKVKGRGRRASDMGFRAREPEKLLLSSLDIGWPVKA